LASASLSYSPLLTTGRRGGAPLAAAAPGGGRRGQRPIANTVLATAAQGDFTTPDDLSKPIKPQITGGDEFFSFLFSESAHQFAELKDLASHGQPLPTFSVPNVKLTFNIDATYQVLQTLYTHNVVGMVEGADARLKDTYVMFGAHLDHTGYAVAPRSQSTAGAAASAATRCPNEEPDDVINNGADDDGSGTVTVLAIAKAFATGPKPKRSVIFIWHAGEEMGLYGSRYSADHPLVPLDKLDAQLNMDMVGRDDWDNRDGDYSNSLYLVGDDRISTELHNVIVDVNAAMKKPLKLDYTMNDPLDPEQVYYRSDHYSYASNGIPIAFFTTGLHSDYHCRSDTADKIHYEKMARIGQLAYDTGLALANMTRFLERDNRGPRAGKGWQGKIGQ
jgi:Zn-dependent M28 family amino/carboxypeptidase